MDLNSASNHHRNIITAFAVLLVGSMLLGKGSEAEPSPVVLLLVLGGMMFIAVSAALLARAIGKSTILWGALGIVSIFVFFVPLFFLIRAANNAFRSEGWSVRFYGGASPP